MAQPTWKATKVREALDALWDRTDAIEGDTCVRCKGQAVVFSDELSRREYRISGLCQKCQDAIFVEDEDGEPWQL